MIDLKYIVTGTGRCGTLFMANLLTSMGYPCSHEAFFTTEGLEWANAVARGEQPVANSEISVGDNLSDYETEIVAESSYMAAPFLKEVKGEVVHVVRNPFGVVGSLIGDGFKQFSACEPTDFEEDPAHLKYEEFMYRHLPELREEMTQLDRGCLYYIRWNEMIEKSGKVCLFHRVEDGPDKVKKFFNFNGECYDNTSCNSATHLCASRKWHLADVQKTEIREDMVKMMMRYGYKLNPVINRIIL